MPADDIQMSNVKARTIKTYHGRETVYFARLGFEATILVIITVRHYLTYIQSYLAYF